MSCNAEGMIASFAVTIRRVRQRNDDLPAATFRWSGGYFYLYLANKCYDSRDYPGCLRYLKEALSANPVLLLKAGIYKIFVKSVFNPITRSNSKGSERAILHSKKRRKYPSILNAVFRHFELARWSAARDDGA